MRMVVLAECGAGALIAAAVGGYNKGEKTLTKEVLVNFEPGMVVTADRNFPGYELWRDAAATGAALLLEPDPALIFQSIRYLKTAATFPD